MYSKRLNRMLKETEQYFNDLECIEKNMKCSRLDKMKLSKLYDRLLILSEVINGICK